MNYYNEIKQELLNNEIYKKVKDYSKNKSDLNTYYNVGKLLVAAGKKYGEKIITNYSLQLTSELGKGYNTTSLKRMRQFYLLIKKGAPLEHQLTWSHYKYLIPLKDINKINYYINQIKLNNLSKRELANKIKNNEYERLDQSTKEKLLKKDNITISDYIKNPIIIKKRFNYSEISEKILKQLILEDLDNFSKSLGQGFSYLENEYKIKLGERYNYIDLLLCNIKFKCYVVIELKITELKKEHIGQIQTYMNYIDKKVKTIEEDKTIGIIIVKKNNKFILEYCSDNRIIAKEYELI